MSLFLLHKGVEVAGVYLEPGATTDVIPEDAIAWLIECGAIEPVEADAKPAKPKKGGK